MKIADPTAVIIVRSLLCAASLWLAVVVLRLGWRRIRGPSEYRQGRTSWEVSLSYATMLVIIAARQPNRKHEAVDLWTYASILAVAFGFVGILRRNRVGRDHPMLPGDREDRP